MAKEKAKEDVDGKEEESKGGGKGGIVMIVAAALISLGIGAGGAFFFASTQVPPPAPPTEVATAESEATELAAKQKKQTNDFKDRLYGLEPLVVNVTGDGYNRFLKLKVELEGDDPMLKDELDARLPQVRDALIVLLSSKQLSDITDFEGKALLKEDILERVNDVLETGMVKSVLFTEFVVQ